MQEIAWVIPCYNEETRINLNDFTRFNALPGTALIFVNDGSTDNTRQLIQNFCKQNKNFFLHDLPVNQGKAQAIRQGLIFAQDTFKNLKAIGYADADLATPVDELMRIQTIFSEEDARSKKIHALLGSRIGILGSQIERKATRHYLGRVFATIASMTLRLRVYDTQCGAKLFRANDTFFQAFQKPFETKWIFDIELIGRLLKLGYREENFIEVPLKKWADVKGSKLSIFSMFTSGLELIVLFLKSLKK